MPRASASSASPRGNAEPPITVTALELDHTVPTVGWVLTEEPRAGKLNSAAVKPLLRAHGLSLKVMRSLKAGAQLRLPDGTIMDPYNFIGPSTQRQLAVFPPTFIAAPAAALHTPEGRHRCGSRRTTLVVRGSEAHRSDHTRIQLHDAVRLSVQVDGSLHVAELESTKSCRENKAVNVAFEASPT